MTKTTAPKLLRCFIGVKFPLLQQIEPLLQALPKPAGDSPLKLRVIPPKNLHLTLKFLGTVHPEQETALAAALTSAAGQLAEFKIKCAGVGFFKDSFWVGISPTSELLNLVSQLNESLQVIGIEPELKPYIPHVTVARFGHLAKPALLEIEERFKATPWGDIHVTKFHLYRSQTLPEGAMYQIISKYDLANG
jgi:2'-5' RNA ligase